MHFHAENSMNEGVDDAEGPFTFYKSVNLQPVCGFQKHIWLKSPAGVKKATLKLLAFLVLQFFTLKQKTHCLQS